MPPAIKDLKPDAPVSAGPVHNRDTSKQPEPRVIDPGTRVNPGGDEKHAAASHEAMEFKTPPATRYRKESDYPLERDLGWKRFFCRGVDNIFINKVQRVREHVWPIYCVLAPDDRAAERVYRETVKVEQENVGREDSQIQVVCDEQPD